jgi:hypothetical protein
MDADSRLGQYPQRLGMDAFAFGFRENLPA